jgi:uncharacterized protein with PIN domain
MEVNILGKAHTHEFFVKRVEDLFGKDTYTILGKYINHGSKILIKHNICGYERKVTPNNFLALQSKCPKCNNKIRYKEIPFKDRVYELVGDEYSVLSECPTNITMVKMRHDICGFEWSIVAHLFAARQSRCPLCAGLATYTTERFKEKVFEVAGDNYSVRGEYINTSTEIEIFHKE